MFPVDRPHPVTGHSADGARPRVRRRGRRARRTAGAGFAVGDMVASGAGVSCGECDRCREGRTNLCQRYYTLGLNIAGGMAEYVAVPDVDARARSRRDCRSTAPAWPSRWPSGCTPPAASGVRDGDRVVLIGAGAIGTFVLAGLVSLGRRRHHRRRLPGRRLERAARARRDPDVAGGRRRARARCATSSGPSGADVVIEASGAPGQLDNAPSTWCAPGGTILRSACPRRRRRWTCTRW